MIVELVDSAVQNFRHQSFTDVPKYFAKRLEVAWPQQWQDDLLRVVERRNSAAHSLEFAQPSPDEVSADLKAILEHGESIARAVAGKHGLQCHSPTMDEVRYGPFDDQEGV